MAERHEDFKKLQDMIEGIRIAMLTTVDDDGTLRSRPMATHDVEFDGDLWFFTQEHSPKVEEVQREHQVNVSYADSGKQRFVSVSGRAVLVTDPAKIRELWTPMLKAWFPEGLDDPELALIKVSVEKAEYWEGPPSKVVQLVGFAKAMVTGKQYDPGENEKIDLKPGA
jgi:general stress protein 26